MALAASGELDLKSGGPSVEGSVARRSIYLKMLRNRRDALLDVFDVADGLNSTPQRNVTTTAPQALLMMNGGWVRERAMAVTERIVDESESDDATLVERAFERLLGRSPSADERDEAEAFLAAQSRRIGDRSPEWLPPWEEIVGRGTGAARLHPESAHERLHLPSHVELPEGDFTIESVFVLDSLYEDAAVRPLASQWSGDEKHPGWSLGVTSKRSRFQSRNLILQLAGETIEGRFEYHVLPSNLHVELGQAYYAAAVVHLAREGEPGQVEFYLQQFTESPTRMQAWSHSSGWRISQ